MQEDTKINKGFIDINGNKFPVDIVVKTKPNNNGGYDTTVCVPTITMSAKKEE